MKTKIGIYCPKSLNNSKFVSPVYVPFGFSCIISEIDLKLYSVNFCDISNYNDFDVLLITVCSHYDTLILFRDFYFKKVYPYIIIGGPDISNLYLLSHVANVICLGRCEGQINDILAGNKLKNVWYKKYDPLLKQKYEIRQPQKLLKNENKQEINIGCSRGCLFCQYSAKFKMYVKSDHYNSGTTTAECMFKDMNIMKNAKRITTSLDGITEEIRKFNHKSVSDTLIFDQFCKPKYQLFEKKLYIKIYMIIGFPDETFDINTFNDFFSLFSTIDIYASRNNLIVDLFFSHFIPMPFTYYQYSPLNQIDFRNLFFEHYDNLIISGKNLILRVSNAFSGPCYAADRLFIYRSTVPGEHLYLMTKSEYWVQKNIDKMKFYEKCSLMNKVKNLPSDIIEIPV